MEQALVSVIIPVYQVSDYIERCLHSVLCQDYPAIECIVVDDATKDDSIEKCEKILEDYNGSIRFRILHHSSNRGLSAARNTGLASLTGDYIYFLDSDDEMTPDCIGTLMAIALKHPEVEMIHGNSRTRQGEASGREEVHPSVPSGILSNDVFIPLFHKHLLSVHAWNKLIKRSFLIDNGITFREGVIYEDQLWLFYVLKYLSKLYVCKEITHYYYIRPNSIVTGTEAHIVGLSFSRIYDEVLHDLTPGNEKAELSCYVIGFCKYYLQHKKTIPKYNQLFRLFWNRSLEHRCLSASSKLCLTYLLSKFPFGLRVLERLQSLRN